MNPYLAQLQHYFAQPHRHVHLDRERLSAFAKDSALKNLEAPAWRDPVYPKDDLEFVEFLGWSSSINFHYTDLKSKEKFATLWPECTTCRQHLMLYDEVGKKKFQCQLHGVVGTLWSGAYGMDACLMRAKSDGVPVFESGFLRDKQKWTKELARFVFRGIEPVPVIPMLGERHELLHKSAVCLEAYGDQWMNVLRMSSFRAFDGGLGAVERLANEFSSYADEYRGFPGSSGPPLPFFKRAHLFVQMYEGRARSSRDLPRIKGSEFLILPADYELPRAFRAAGAFVYSEALREKIVQKKEIKEGSSDEIEIRLATVEGGEILKEEINVVREAHGLAPYTAIEIDYLLWGMGRHAEEPHHLTRTTKY